MGPGALEVADIFRTHGPALRLAQRSHLSLGQLKVMTAIEQCCTAALGGHVLRCPDCQQIQVSYNSCRNRHCPKCQANAAKRWLEARQADLLPVDYYAHFKWAFCFLAQIWPTPGPLLAHTILNISDCDHSPLAQSITTIGSLTILHTTMKRRSRADDQQDQPSDR